MEEWESDFDAFVTEMKLKILQAKDRKGIGWMGCDSAYLKLKAAEHARFEHYPDVANYCFMLWAQQEEKKLKDNSLQPVFEKQKTPIGEQ